MHSISSKAIMKHAKSVVNQQRTNAISVFKSVTVLEMSYL